MSDAWSREEVEAAVAEYFTMLGKELREEAYIKAEHNRQLQRFLKNRTRPSIERKHQNISAVLIGLGYPYIDGYKPLGNLQKLLQTVVEERLSKAGKLRELVAVAVESKVEATPRISNILSILVDPPVCEPRGRRLYDDSAPRITPIRRNYLEIEARNHSLGRAGEELVLNFEHECLWRAGKRNLADRIEHVATTQGDHLGYDIHSFEPDGRDRLIEVKTTRFGASTPFFASRNEVEVSEDRRNDYHIYRVFAFRAQPRMFTLAGPLRSSCQLEPCSYSAIPR